MIKVTEIVEVTRNGERKKLEEFTSLFRTEDEAVDYIFECCKPVFAAILGDDADEGYVQSAYTELKNQVQHHVNTGKTVVLEGYVQVSFIIERRD